MTNRLALVLGVLIVTGIVADLLFNDGSGVTFLARKFSDLIEWLAIWR